VISARHYLVSLNLFMCTIAATGLNLGLWCFNTVVWATNGLSICETIVILFLSNGNKITNVLDS